MKTLELVQGFRQASAAIQKLDLVVLTTYTDREALTVDEVFFFAAQTAYYDWENTNTVREFQPYLVRVDPSGDVMTHLPLGRDVESLKRSRLLTLRNGDRDGEKLYKTLKGKNLERARVDIATLLIDGSAADRFNRLESFSGSEHTYLFRGRVAEVLDVNVAEIALRLESDTPTLRLIPVSDDTQNEPADLGKNLPVIYGSMPHVPAIGWTVSAFTTLAEDITAGATGTIEVTSITGIASGSGSGRLGKEVISWTGTQASPPAVLGVSRGQSGTNAVAHVIGEGLLELISSYVFVVAGHESKAVNDVYAHNSVGELVRITTGFSVNLSNTALISGETVTSVTFTQAQFEAMLDNLGVTAVVSEQSVVTHLITQTQPEESATTGRSDLRDNDTGSGQQYGTNSFPASGNPTTTGNMTYPSPSGSIISQIVRVHHGGISSFGSGSRLQGKIDVKVGGTIIGTITSGSGFKEFPTALTSNVHRCDVGMTGTGGLLNMTAFINEMRRILLVETNTPTSTDTAIAAAGARLPIFADVDGVVVPPVTADGEGIFLGATDGIGLNFVSLPPGETGVKAFAFGKDKIPAFDTWTQVTLDFTDPNTLDLSNVTDLRVSFNQATFEDDLAGLRWYLDELTVDLGAGHVPVESFDATASEWLFDLGTPAAEVSDDTTIVQEGSASLKMVSVDTVSHQLRRLFTGGPLDWTGIIEAKIWVYVPTPPASFYQASVGQLVEKPADILLHYISVIGGLGQAALDGDSLETINTNLGSNKHALILETLGADFSGILNRLGFEFRVNVIAREKTARTVYTLFAAESDYEWPASSRTLTLWGGIQERSRTSEGLTTRRQTVYQVDPARATATADGFEGLVRIDADQNDVTNPSVAELQAAEAAFGRRDAIEVGVLLASQDQATARDVAGYYAHEDIRKAGTYTLTGVPHVESFDLERGDVVDFSNDNTGDVVKGRVVSVTHNPQTEAGDVVVVEVP